VIVLAPKKQTFQGGAAFGGDGGSLPSAERQQEVVGQLVEMGIPEDKAREALGRNGWSLARAVEYIYSQ